MILPFFHSDVGWLTVSIRSKPSAAPWSPTKKDISVNSSWHCHVTWTTWIMQLFRLNNFFMLLVIYTLWPWTKIWTDDLFTWKSEIIRYLSELQQYEDVIDMKILHFTMILTKRRPTTSGIFSALQLLQRCFLEGWKRVFYHKYSFFRKFSNFSKLKNILIFLQKRNSILVERHS